MLTGEVSFSFQLQLHSCVAKSCSRKRRVTEMQSIAFASCTEIHGGGYWIGIVVGIHEDCPGDCSSRELLRSVAETNGKIRNK